MSLSWRIFSCIFITSVCCFQSGLLQSFAPKDECTTQGRQCNSNCTQVIFCPSVPGSSIPVEDCASRGQSCATINNEATCAANKTDCQKNFDIVCGEDGIYPDPYQCSSSYVCASSAISVTCDCGDDFYWNTFQSTCSDDVGGLDACCKYISKPVCDEDHFDGTFGPLCHTGAGYYYICLLQGSDYKISVLRCPPDELYNTDVHACVPFGKSQEVNVGIRKQPVCEKTSTSSPPTEGPPENSTDLYY